MTAAGVGVCVEVFFFFDDRCQVITNKERWMGKEYSSLPVIVVIAESTCLVLRVDVSEGLEGGNRSVIAFCFLPLLLARPPSSQHLSSYFSSLRQQHHSRVMVGLMAWTVKRRGTEFPSLSKWIP